MIHLIFNWKQGPATISMATELLMLAKHSGVKITICPPNWYLPLVSHYHGDTLSLGLQDIIAENTGKNTGSAELHSLLQFDARYCLVGHSETRALQKLSEPDIVKKMSALSSKNITPILCVGYITPGENEIERLEIQLETVKNISAIVAYEPLSAIGSGIVPDSSILQRTFSTMTQLVKSKITWCYGGSVDATNLEMLHRTLGISTFLVGSASIDIKKCRELLAVATQIDKA